STHEMREAKLAPSEDGQPPIMVQHDTSPDPHVGPREALERHGNQEDSQDPSLQDNPQPQDPNQGAKCGRKQILLGLSFPRKLWRIVEDNSFMSVHWNDDGDTVIIEENLFQKEILCLRGKEQIFEWNSLKSFICLLNRHGFSKICTVCSPGNRIMIYRNCNFQRGKPWLLKNITTQGTSITLQKRKNMAPTRHSPRIHQKVSNKEAEEKAQETGKNEWGPNATQAFEFSVPQLMGSAREVQCPSAVSGSSGEGTSGSVMFVPAATAGTDGKGDLPPQGSVMSLHNICYSTLIAGLSVMAPSEDLDQAEEEEHEGSSDNKCSLCEQFKDNAGP
uniref:HSF-type DNA-binding domain-containing protein n=1 Tax=Myotis lucifugus TaxID=59463 RepID=G1Q172_MYOLU